MLSMILVLFDMKSRIKLIHNIVSEKKGRFLLIIIFKHIVIFVEYISR